MAKKSRYAHLVKETQSVNDLGKTLGQLELVREKLMNTILEYKALLDETVLLSNRAQPEKQKMRGLLEKINQLAAELSTLNQGEGSLVLGTVALNSLLILKDEINQLKFHNYFLTKRLEKLENQSEKDSSADEQPADSTE